VVGTGNEAADGSAAECERGGGGGSLAAAAAGTDIEAGRAVSLVIFSSKPEAETRWVTVDFIGRCAPGETLTSASTWVEMHGGTDFRPSAILKGAATVSGTEVSQMVTGGTIGNIYRLSFNAATSAGQFLQLSGLLVVIPDVIDSFALPAHLPTGF
jgi:hypothetical protein